VTIFRTEELESGGDTLLQNVSNDLLLHNVTLQYTGILIYFPLFKMVNQKVQLARLNTEQETYTLLVCKERIQECV
jgi:hypothetical protein